MKDFFSSARLARITIFMLLTEFLWGLGSFFVLLTTTQVAYLTVLKASPLHISALYVAMATMGTLPQLFGRTVLERFRHRKRAIIFFHLLCALPYLLVALLHGLVASERPGMQILLTIGLLALSQITLGFAVPVWMDMQAAVIPLHLRGRYYGLSAFFFAGGGVLGGLGIGQLQHRLGDGAFPVAFMVACGFFVLSMVAFALAPIPAQAFEHPPEPSVWSRIAKSLRACHPRTDFGRLVISNAVYGVAAAIVPFMLAFAFDMNVGLGYPKTITGWATIAQALGSACGGLALGWLVDRMGPRRPWLLATALIPVAMLLMPQGHLYLVLMIAFVLAGVLNTPWAVTGPAMLELSPPGDKSGYIAIANVVNFPMTTLGAFVLGLCVKYGSYRLAFLVAAGFGLLAFCIALTLRSRATQDEPALPVETP